jgi:hypothetical protein
MDAIEFKIETYSYRNFGRQAEVVPVINGVPLRDTVSKLFSNLLGQHAGTQTGIRADEIANFGTGYFLGKSKHRLWRKKDTVGVLACGCGLAECWTLETPIEMDSAAVGWPSFIQPDRPRLSYSGLGPFKFGRSQYEEAVTDLENRLNL